MTFKFDAVPAKLFLPFCLFDLLALGEIVFEHFAVKFEPMSFKFVEIGHEFLINLYVSAKSGEFLLTIE